MSLLVSNGFLVCLKKSKEALEVSGVGFATYFFEGRTSLFVFFSVPLSVNLPCLWVLGVSLLRLVHPQERLLRGSPAAALPASLPALPPERRPYPCFTGARRHGLGDAVKARGLRSRRRATGTAGPSFWEGACCATALRLSVRNWVCALRVWSLGLVLRFFLRITDTKPSSFALEPGWSAWGEFLSIFI